MRVFKVDGMELYFSRNLETVQEVSSAETCTGEPVRKAKAPPKEEQKPNRPKFLHIHVKAIFQGLVTGASLLPSLKAQHKVVIKSCVDRDSSNPYSINYV